MTDRRDEEAGADSVDDRLNEGGNASNSSPGASSDDAQVSPESTLSMPPSGEGQRPQHAAVLEEFARTMPPEHRDLDAASPLVTLRPMDVEGENRPASLASFTHLQSIRPRSVQPSDDDDHSSERAGSVGDSAPRDISMDYVTMEKLGEGGMATVHLARQVALGREVALKRIHQRSRSEDAVREELLKEAVLTGRLEHPNIIPIYEVGESDDGELFYSMKKIEGRTWDETIDERPLEENLKILLDVCDAVAFAHAEGVLHRDLKPQNVMTGEFGEVLVLDWGLAVLTDPGEDVNVTAGGTPGYMAPEMIKPPYLVGPRSDVYLLGAVLFRILTGQAPHSSKTAQTSLTAVYENEIIEPDRARVEGLDPTGELLAVALKAMATAPADRHQNVAALQAAIRGFESHKESLKLTVNAEATLRTADQGRDYADFARAMVGFEEAVTLWSENEAAVKGADKARQSYAMCAEAKGDFELGLSLLDTNKAGHRALAHRLTAAIDARKNQQATLRRIKQGLAVAASATILVGVYALYASQANAKIRLEAEHSKQLAAEANARVRLEAEHNKQLAAALGQEVEVSVATTERLRESKYRADMNLAAVAWDVGRANLIGARLDPYRADEGTSRDLRGFEWRFLERQRRTDIRTLAGKLSSARAVAFSPSGDRAAAGDAVGAVRLWDPTTGEEVAAIDGHRDLITALTFSPDGARLMTASRDHTVRLWDAKTGAQRAVLDGHNQPVVSAVFSATGERVATSSWDKTVRVWDAVTGASLATCKGHDSSVIEVAFSRDGKRLASAGHDKSVCLWNAETGEQLLRFAGHEAAVVHVAFHPNEPLLFSACRSGQMIIWDLDAGKALKKIDAHDRWVTDMVFSPDGAKVATCSYDRTVKAWDSRTGALLGTFVGHNGAVWSVAFSPDSAQIASASQDASVRQWTISARGATAVSTGHAGGVRSVAFSPDGRMLASAGDDGLVKLWPGVASGVMSPFAGHVDQVRRVLFSPDGQYIVSASNDKTLRLWDTETGFEVRRFIGNVSPVASVAFSPDGKRIASAGDDFSMRIWDVHTGAELYTVFGHGHYCTDVAYSFDGSMLVTCSTERSKYPVILRDGDTGAAYRALLGPKDHVQDVMFSPDDSLVGAVSKSSIWFWDSKSGKQIHKLTEPGLFLTSACFSPDGRTLVAGSASGAIVFWDTSTWRKVCTLVEEGGTVEEVAFNPDGSRLASTSAVGSIKLWDVATHALLATFTRHKRGTRGVAFSPDGDRLVTCDSGRTIKLWDGRPWTSAQRDSVEVRSYLARHTLDKASRSALEAAIREDKTLSDAVRAQALRWAEVCWNAAFVLPHTGRVQALYNQGLVKSEVIQAIAKDQEWRALTPATPEELAEVAAASVPKLNSAAWPIVSASNRSDADYAKALQMAERLLELVPQDGLVLNTVGLAQYRAGQYEAAIETLSRSAVLNAAKYPGSPHDNVFLAMAHQRLGNGGAAQALLAKMRELIPALPNSKDKNELLGFLREANDLIDPQDNPSGGK